jgi:hypothetical protein
MVARILSHLSLRLSNGCPDIRLDLNLRRYESSGQVSVRRYGLMNSALIPCRIIHVLEMALLRNNYLRLNGYLGQALSLMSLLGVTPAYRLASNATSMLLQSSDSKAGPVTSEAWNALAPFVVQSRQLPGECLLEAGGSVDKLLLVLEVQ